MSEQPSARTYKRKLSRAGVEARDAFRAALVEWQRAPSAKQFGTTGFHGLTYLRHAQKTTAWQEALTETAAAQREWLDWLASCGETKPGARCETCRHWTRDRVRATCLVRGPVLPEVMGKCAVLTAEEAFDNWGPLKVSSFKMFPIGATEPADASTFHHFVCPKYTDKRKPHLTVIDGGEVAA